MTKSKVDTGKTAKAPPPKAILVATETFTGTVDNGEQVMFYANVTTVSAGSPAAKKWPTLFKSAA